MLKLVLWIRILLPVFPIFETLMSLNFEKNKLPSKITIFSSLQENSIEYFDSEVNQCVSDHAI